MIPSLILSLLVLLSEGDPVPLDHLSGDFIASAATAHGKTLILSPWYRKGSLPKVHTYLVDLETKTAHEIEDARIQTSVLVQVSPESDGFLLSDNYTGKLYYLDTDGELVDTERLIGYAGYDPATRIQAVFARDWEHGLYLVTSRVTAMPSRVKLEVMDTNGKRMTVLHRIRFVESERCFWAPLGDELVFVVPETGRVDRVDPARFHRVKTLVPEEKGFLREGRSLPLLTTPILVQGRMYLQKNVFYNELGDPIAKPRKALVAIRSDDPGISRGKIMVLGRSGDTDLVYDIVAREYGFRASSL